MFIVSNLLFLMIITVILLFYSYVVGYPFARKVNKYGSFELSFPLGIAILGITALWINNLFNIGTFQAAIIFLFPLGLTFWINKPSIECYKKGFSDKPIIILPLILSFIAVSGVFIKINGSDVGISTPLFDHIKIALVNSIVRDGFPIINPFCIDPSAGELFHYYYLFYLLSANIVVFFHCSGLNADIILAFISAFISIFTCFYLLSKLFSKSINKKKCQYLFCFFLFSGSIVSFVDLLTGYKLFKILSNVHPLESWIVQAAWVPQHLLAASCSVLALFLIGVKNLNNKIILFSIIILVGAGFSFSVWVGGLTFAVVSLMIFVEQIVGKKNKKNVLINWLWLVLGSFIIILPIMYNVITVPVRESGFPIRIFIYNSSVYKQFIDFIFFFTGAMILWFPVIIIGLYCLIFEILLKRIKIDPSFRVILFICLGSIFVSLFIHSSIYNDDLGWRAILLFVLTGTTIVTFYVNEYCSSFKKAIFIFIALIGIIEPLNFSKMLIFGADYYRPRPSLKELNKITHQTHKQDRLLINIHQNETFEPWGGNLLPPVMVNRKFCFQNISYVKTFGPNWGDKVELMDHAIRQFYNGKANDKDLALIKQFQCNAIIVTRYDPVWSYMPYTDLTSVYSDKNLRIYNFNR